MVFLEAIILGLVQGLTEFLPISSSGHLVLAQHFFGWSEGGDNSFEIFVHLGSLMAVLIYFRVKILSLLKSLVYLKDKGLVEERKMCLWICIATLVTGAIGFTAKDFFEAMFSNPLLIACMLAVTGGIIFCSDRLKTPDGRHQKPEPPPLPPSERYAVCGRRYAGTPPDPPISPLAKGGRAVGRAIFIGFGQAVAIIPGLSRSGTTITCSLLVGLDRKTAAAFSFLLSIPAILGANLSELKTFTSLDTSQLGVYLAGFIAAFVSGYLVISWLLRLIVKAKLRYFSYYCWAVSLVSIVLIVSV